MDIHVSAKPGETSGILKLDGQEYTCRLGRSGIIAADLKKEGDGATPLGAYPLRCIYYRLGTVQEPATGLQTIPYSSGMGWCDDSAHHKYNQPVTLPFPASHEDWDKIGAVYNYIVVIGYNDHPPIPGKGSAIFLHLERPEQTPTEGCVALSENDLLAVLAKLSADSRIIIEQV